MGQDTVVEWLNENALRAYPLTESSSRFITVNGVQIDLYTVILDANLIYTTVSTTPQYLTISYAGGLRGHLSFKIGDQFTITTALHSVQAADYPIYIRDTGNLITLGEGTALLIAALILGPLALEINTDATFEPSVITEFSGLTAGVSSVAFADNLVSYGDIVLVEGYQTNIQLIEQAVQLTVGKNEGRVLGCDNFFPDTAPDDCGGIVSHINGATPRVSGGIIKLVAGDNVKIFEDPERARIYVGVDFGPTDPCIPPTLPPAP